MPTELLLPALHGSIPALPTPFLPGDPASLDRAALARLAERAERGGSSAVVVAGSTGEGPALHPEAHAEAIRTAAAALRGRLPVIAGVGAPNTEGAAALAATAERCGAAALLVSAPAYVRQTQDELRAHVRAVAATSGLPVVLYDVPSRAGVAFANETIARLREDGVIQGLKDATADLARPARLRRVCGDDFPQLSGDDATALAHQAMGGAGCISVTANVVPSLCAALHAAWDARDWASAQQLRDLLAPLHDALFAETNPIPAKGALALLGLCDPTPRLPLMRAARGTMSRLAEILPHLAAEDERPPTRRRRAA
jgi:4-hydroxy-tetrahydrodipicolinate synthase